VKRYRARRYYATRPATQNSENRTYQYRYALVAGAGAGVAGVLSPVVA